MASETEIVNSALIKIGADTVISIDDDVETARKAKQQYPVLRDALLRGHPWNFATRRATLAQLVPDPPFGFNKRYQLPTDFLRVLSIGDDSIKYAIESDELLTDEGAVELVYVARIIDPNEFDASFREVLAFRLAADLAYKISKNAQLAQNLHQLADRELGLARTFDAQEGNLQHFIEANTWLDARN